MHTHVYIYVYRGMYIYIYVNMCMYIYIHICIYVYICIYIYTHGYIYIYIYIYMYVCMYVCTSKYAYIYIYVDIHTYMFICVWLSIARPPPPRRVRGLGKCLFSRPPLWSCLLGRGRSLAEQRATHCMFLLDPFWFVSVAAENENMIQHAFTIFPSRIWNIKCI